MPGIIQVGVTNNLTATFNATAKTLAIAGCTAFDLTVADMVYVWNTTRSAAFSLTNVTMARTWSSGQPLFTYTFGTVPTSSADGDTLVIYLQVPTEFMNFLVLQKIAVP